MKFGLKLVIGIIQEIVNFYENVRRDGLNTFTPDGEKLSDFTKTILKKSGEGLVRRNIKTDRGNESIFRTTKKNLRIR